MVPRDSAVYARAPDQPVDQAYTAQIRKFTTDPSFNSPLTDYLPASASVPTPSKVLGHIAGVPDYLPYSAVHRYFRALAAASPPVKVFTIGKSEEGREMIVAAIADEKLLAELDAKPIWRGETIGSYPLVLNAIVHFDALDSGRK